jgi:hypothetical protein
MTKRSKKPRTKVIPAEAWGPGAQIDWEKSRLVAPDGTVYENIMLNAADVMRLWPPVKRH